VTVTLHIVDFNSRPWVNYAEITADGADDYDTSGYENPADNDVEDADSVPNPDISDDVLVDQTVVPDAQYNDPAVDEDDHDIAPIDANIDYDLALIKRLPAGQSFKAGSNIAFDIVVMNQGNVDSGPITVVDRIPAGLTFVSADHLGLSAGQTVSWDIDNLTPGQILTLHLVVRMTDTTKTSYINLAEIVADGADAYDIDGSDIEDDDSTPDDDLTNDPLVDTDDVTVDHLNGDEDDHDRALLDPTKVVSDNPTPPIIPVTGSDATPMLLAAVLLVGAGAFVSLISSRRRRPHH